MLPKKRLARAELEGEDTIIRGANARQTFQNILGMHFESADAIQGKFHEGDGDDESDEDEISQSRATGQNKQIPQIDNISPSGPQKKARIEQNPQSAHRNELVEHEG